MRGGRGKNPEPSLPAGTRIVERDSEGYAEYGDAEGREVRVGAHVHHRTFGRGVVRAVEPGASPTIVAWFKSVGTKRVKAEYLSFE